MPALAISFDVTFADDRTETVEVTPSDLIAWEQHFNLGTGDLDLARLEHRWFLVWTRQKKDGKTELPFEDWADTVTKVADAKVEEIPPLESSASTG